MNSKQHQVNLKRYTYFSLLRTILPVTHHLANTALFLSIFTRLRAGLLDPRVLVYVTSALSIIGFGIYECTSSSPHTITAPGPGPKSARSARLAQAVKSSILLFLALASLAPVLRTLTAATSDDSIWALSAILFILHALLADYAPEPLVLTRVGPGTGDVSPSQPQGG